MSITTPAHPVCGPELGLGAGSVHRELVFRLLRAANWPITPPGQLPLRGVSTDTGSFQYPSTRPSTYNVAAELVKRGANLADICTEVYHPIRCPGAIDAARPEPFQTRRSEPDCVFWLRPSDYARTGPMKVKRRPHRSPRAIEPWSWPASSRKSTRRSSGSVCVPEQRVNVYEIARQFNGGGIPPPLAPASPAAAVDPAPGVGRHQET